MIWFSNRIEDAIKSYYDPEGDFIYTSDNLPGKTTTDGLEVGLRGDWLDESLAYRIAWTYLHQSFSDQPRNAVTAALDWKPTDKALLGIGMTHLSAHSWGGHPLESYTLFRIHGSYQIWDRVKLHARVENLFDESYELANFTGTPVNGAGTGLYAGITIDW
jgi:outer membrane receptor protein involved in Fe transport